MKQDVWAPAFRCWPFGQQ